MEGESDIQKLDRLLKNLPLLGLLRRLNPGFDRGRVVSMLASRPEGAGVIDDAGGMEDETPK
ncbi:MAG: hypothetical protein AAF564_22220 [Bacteroidota bacterium]